MTVKLASILSTEQERTREITEECNALKCSLETVQNRNELLENEAKGKKQEVEELRLQIKSRSWSSPSKLMTCPKNNLNRKRRSTRILLQN